MRQRSARVISGAMAWIVLVAAAVFLFRSEKDIDTMRSALRAFDLQARETTDALAELRAVIVVRVQPARDEQERRRREEAELVQRQPEQERTQGVERRRSRLSRGQAFQARKSYTRA